jgi:hypothetical protein
MIFGLAASVKDHFPFVILHFSSFIPHSGKLAQLWANVARPNGK